MTSQPDDSTGVKPHVGEYRIIRHSPLTNEELAIMMSRFSLPAYLRILVGKPRSPKELFANDATPNWKFTMCVVMFCWMSESM